MRERKVSRLEMHFRGGINRIGHEGRRQKQSRTIPRFLAAESMESLFTGMGNSGGEANLGMGKIKSSVLAMLTKTSVWW